MMVTELEISDLRLLRPSRHHDGRGWFTETWNRQAFTACGLHVDFVQDNVTANHRAGTVRGLHFQHPPQCQAKLVTVLSGKIHDVVVDLRAGSPCFGKHITLTLSAEDGGMLFIPKGFAHGFCTLEDHTLVAYKVDAPYAPESEGAIHWRDPTLAIAWPIDEDQAVLSDKDRRAAPWNGRSLEVG